MNMTYTLKKEELGNDLLLVVLEALAKAYKEIGAEAYVVGAVARDLSLKLLKTGNAPRRTMDLDVAVLLDRWEEYEGLTDILIKDGFVKAPEKQRFYYCGVEAGRYEVDIVPFGDIARKEMVAWPPEGNPVMSVRCFADVMKNADNVVVEGRFAFRMASLSGQWLIKLDAWCDRHLVTRKDAADMQYILENAYIALALSSDSIPETISLDASTFDQTVAGAEWIASDLLNMLSEDHKVYYADMLDNEVAQQENSPLVNDLLDNAAIGTYDSIRRALTRMSQILRQ